MRSVAKPLAAPEVQSFDRATMAAIYDAEYTAAYRHPPVAGRGLEFADHILGRDARALEYAVNGLNEGSKRAFVRVTGIQLPPAQGRSWVMMREWGGITDAEEALHCALKTQAVKHNTLKGNLSSDTAFDEMVDWINGRLDEGLVHLSKVNKKHYLHNGEGRGISLSEKGQHLNMLRPSIAAMIEVRKAQAEVDEQNRQV